MNKETWIKHLESTTGLIRPSRGGDPEAWKAAQVSHKVNHCIECKVRTSTRAKNHRAQARRSMLDAAMKSLGLTKVKGALGGVYWE